LISVYICFTSKKLENELKKTTKPKDDGVWVVQIYEEQSVEKKKFETETAAIAWAANFAREVNTKAGSDFNNLTFFDLMQRYLDEVSIKTVSHKKNVVMIRFLEKIIIEGTNRKKYPIFSVNLQDLSKKDFIDFREQRAKDVSAGTFLNDWNKFKAAMSMGCGEWGWVHKNIMTGIRVPKQPAHRYRRVTLEEEIAIQNFLKNPESKSRIQKKNELQSAIIFQLALETALRLSEITALKKEEIYLDDGFLMVTGIEPSAGKSAAAIRSVPLTPNAKSLLSEAMLCTPRSKFVFSTSKYIAVLTLRNCFKKLGIVDLHFHDTRHEGISRLAKIYGILDLAKIAGHSSVEYLLTYYQPTIYELVDKMKKLEKNN
jgi:integrase